MPDWCAQSNRPAIVVDHAELIRRLLNLIDGNQHRHKNIPSFVSCLEKREFGILSASRFGRLSILSILGSRKYSMTDLYKMKGKVLIEKNLMIKVNEREIYDITTNEHLCTIKLLQYKEQIQCSLYIDCGHRISGKLAGQISSCLILLTNFGRVMFVNVIDGTVEAIFVLPTETFRYRKMYWRKTRTSFTVFGETKKPLHGASTHHIVALFRVAPISYDGLFVLNKKDFGFSNHIGEFNEFLIFFSRQPQRVIAYNIDDFSLQRSMVIHRYEDTSYAEILLDSTATIVDIPKRQFAFDGNWDFIQIGVTSSMYMLCPSSKRGSFLLGDWANRPIRIPFSLKQSPNASIQTNNQDIFLHLDGSGRVLCVKDSFVVCYCLRTTDNMLEYVEQWRRKLWVDGSFYERLLQNVTMTSRSGRQIKLSVPPIENYIKDDRLVLIDICFDIDNELIYIICICDMNSTVFDNPNCPCSMISVHNRLMNKGGLIFVLDDCTGEIITVILQCNEAIEEWQRMKFSATGITATFELRCREGTYVEVHRLLEMGVKE